MIEASRNQGGFFCCAMHSGAQIIAAISGPRQRVGDNFAVSK